MAYVYFAGKLDSALNLVGTQTSGTSVHMARSTVDNSLDPLDIGLPGTVGTSVGVGNLDTKGHALAAKITLSHSLHLQSKNTHYSPVHRRLDMIADIDEKSKHFFQNFSIFFIKMIAITASYRYNGIIIWKRGGKCGRYLLCTPDKVGAGS